MLKTKAIIATLKQILINLRSGIKPTLRGTRAIYFELNNDVGSFDTPMLLAQTGYFGHHLEKALKHNNRGTRGLKKRDKLVLLSNELEKRKQAPSIVKWAKHLINEYDMDNPIYIKPINKETQTPKETDSLIQFIENRTSTRFWQNQEVDLSIVKSILKTSYTSSLSCNRQSIRFGVIKNTPSNFEIGESNNNSMLKKAPILVYIFGDNRFFKEKFGNALNVGGVCTALQLAAEAHQLSSCWMYFCESYNQNKARKLFNLEKHYYCYSIIALGYPYDNQEKPPRVDINLMLDIKEY